MSEEDDPKARVEFDDIDAEDVEDVEDLDAEFSQKAGSIILSIY